ncbi:GerMN domain-containing protein, partial [Lentzea rhizosphaerae]
MTRRTRIVIAAVAATTVVLGLVVVLVTLRRNRTEPAAPTSATTTATSAPASSSGETTNLLVYFHRGAPGDAGQVVAVRRSVPKTVAVATAALNELLPGPTAAEQADGYWSMFVPGTARALKSVRVVDGVAHVDFRDFRDTIPNASSSF